MIESTSFPLKADLGWLRHVSFNYYAETSVKVNMIYLGLRNFFFVWAWLRSRLDSWECKSVEARQEDCEAKIIAWIGWFGSRRGNGSGEGGKQYCMLDRGRAAGQNTGRLCGIWPCNPLCSLAVLNDAVLERAAILHKKVLGSLTFEVVRGGVGVQAKELGSLSGSGGGPALIEALRKHATEIGAQFLVTVRLECRSRRWVWQPWSPKNNLCVCVCFALFGAYARIIAVQKIQEVVRWHGHRQNVSNTGLDCVSTVCNNRAP